MTNPISRLATICLFCVAIWLIACSMVSLSYSEMQDNSDRLAQNNSPVFSPGYINAAKQKTESIVNQANVKKGLFERITNFLNNDTADKAEEPLQGKAMPELQKKNSSGGTPQLADSAAFNVSGQKIGVIGPTGISGADMPNIAIGAGTGIYRDGGRMEYSPIDGFDIWVPDGTRRLMGESINDKFYLYAGFNNIGYGSIQEAINSASSGTTIIVGGMWNGSENVTLRGGVSLYGGYNEDGAWGQVARVGSFTASGIQPDEDSPAYRTTVSGFSIGSSYINNSSNLVFSNNTFYGSAKIAGSSVLFSNNNLSNIVATNGSNLTIRNSSGGTIELNGSSADAVNNVLSGITGRDSSTVLAKNNNFGGNGVWAYGSSMSVENNTFSKYSKVLLMDNSDASVTNNKFVSAGITASNSSKATSTGNSFGGTSLLLVAQTKSTIDSSNDYIASNSKLAVIKSGGGQVSVISPLTKEIALAKTAMVTSQFMPNNIAAAYQSYLTSENKSKLIGAILKDQMSENSIASGAIGAIFGDILKERDSLLTGDKGELNSGLLESIVNNALASQYAFAPAADMDPGIAEAALVMTNILSNPTEDQKVVIDAISALLTDMAKVNPEQDAVKQATNNLMEAAAKVLLVQALPDLLKEGDMASIKGIFSALKNSNGKLISDYQDSTRPYYDELKKTLSQDIAILQQKNILSKQMTKEELEKLPPLKIGEILDKLRKSEKKTFEEEYILQQEAKYREKYIDPNKKRLEDNMKTMLQQFSKRLYSTLDAANIAEAKVVTKNGTGELLRDTSKK